MSGKARTCASSYTFWQGISPRKILAKILLVSYVIDYFPSSESTRLSNFLLFHDTLGCSYSYAIFKPDETLFFTRLKPLCHLGLVSRQDDSRSGMKKFSYA